jgi:uroporphyrinogen decarboxylase
MDSRQRVLQALSHREPDRVPFDLSSTPVTGIHREALVQLRRALGLEEREPRVWHLMQQLGWVDEDLHQVLETDVRGARPNPQSTWELVLRDEGEYRYCTDEWGITRRTPIEGGNYYDLCASPLAGAQTLADIERYPWPDPVDPARFAPLEAAALAARRAGKAFVLGGIAPGMLEMGQWLRGYENFFCDLAADRKMAEALCEKIIELKLRYWEAALSRVGQWVDVVQEGDDYGAQQSLQVDPGLWRQVFKPRLARLLGGIKKLAPHTRLFFHSCGSLIAILPDLIEVGVEILNPVQVAAAGMDSRDLKRRFGADLVFWGGGVDTQRVLPAGTPAQVRDEVRRRIEDLAPGGGFVFAAVHNIQVDVPPENILAMRQALREYGAY